MLNKNCQKVPINKMKKLENSGKKDFSFFGPAERTTFGSKTISAVNLSKYYLPNQTKPKYHHTLKPNSTQSNLKSNLSKKSLKNFITPSSKTYSQKLHHAERIINDAKKLSDTYGFFYLTKAMVDFKESEKGLICWIHPNKNYETPLHPIKKKTKEEAQKEFYLHLKRFIKDLYPNISQSSGNSFQDVMNHILHLKLRNFTRIKKKSSFAKLQETAKTLIRVKSSEQVILEKEKVLNYLLNEKNRKNHWQSFQKEDQYPDEQTTIKKDNQEYQKNTMSTLLDSMKSNASLKERLIKEKVRCFEKQYQGKKSVIIENKKEQSQKGEEGSLENVPESPIGIQNDFDDLFSQEGEDLDEDFQIEKVTKEFEDLLFS